MQSLHRDGVLLALARLFGDPRRLAWLSQVTHRPSAGLGPDTAMAAK
jgi:hypothetical protein